MPDYQEQSSAPGNDISATTDLKDDLFLQAFLLQHGITSTGVSLPSECVDPELVMLLHMCPSSAGDESCFSPPDKQLVLELQEPWSTGTA